MKKILFLIVALGSMLTCLFYAFDSSFFQNNEVEKKNVTLILEKEKITTEYEYRLLLNRIEEIHTDPSKQKEVENINVLLAEYHKNK